LYKNREEITQENERQRLLDKQAVVLENNVSLHYHHLIKIKTIIIIQYQKWLFKRQQMVNKKSHILCFILHEFHHSIT
jgi:hypothetical protein